MRWGYYVTTLLVVDDFNSHLPLVDKQGGLRVTNHCTADFEDFVMKEGMEDMHSYGCHYT